MDNSRNFYVACISAVLSYRFCVILSYKLYTYVTFKPIFHCDAKFWRRGVALGNSPDARLLRWEYQQVGIFWRYPRRQFPTPILKFALLPTPTPDASQWNIGGVGPSGVGHVHFMLFMSISFASGTQHKLVFWWNMGFRVRQRRVLLKPMTDVASKWHLLAVICLLQGVASSSWNSLELFQRVACHVPATVYLQ